MKASAKCKWKIQQHITSMAAAMGSSFYRYKNKAITKRQAAKALTHSVISECGPEVRLPYEWHHTLPHSFDFTPALPRSLCLLVTKNSLNLLLFRNEKGNRCNGKHKVITYTDKLVYQGHVHYSHLISPVL